MITNGDLNYTRKFMNKKTKNPLDSILNMDENWYILKRGEKIEIGDEWLSDEGWKPYSKASLGYCIYGRISRRKTEKEETAPAEKNKENLF